MFDMSLVDTNARLEPSVLEYWPPATVERLTSEVLSAGFRFSVSGVGDLLPPVDTLAFLDSDCLCDIPGLSAMLLLMLRVMPGKPSLVSYRVAGVAVGSMDTADRTGNTRSMEPGLKADDTSLPLEGDFCESPVNMLTEVCRGPEGSLLSVVLCRGLPGTADARC